MDSGLKLPSDDNGISKGDLLVSISSLIGKFSDEELNDSTKRRKRIRVAIDTVKELLSE